MNEEFEGIGTRIIERMKVLNLKQVDVIRETGISKTAISNYVNGNRVPDSMSIYKLSKILKVSIEWLLTGTQTKTTKNNSESLSEIEQDIIGMFRQVGDVEKEDILDFTKMKYDKAVKKGKATSLYSTYTKESEENDKPKSSPDKKGSGIA